MLILDGKETARRLRGELKDEIAGLRGEIGRGPGLAVILVGDDPASQVYVRNKERACAEVGIASETFRLPSSTPQGELEERIEALNRDPAVDGILLQLPLPSGLDSRRCLQLIDPSKDVDGFHPLNVGRLTLGLPGLRSCTPAGVMTLLDRYGLDPGGRKSVIIGRSNIVGKPLALLLLQRNATVTVCHSRTPDLGAETRQADFLFAAVGRAGLVTREMVKPGAVVVDVGMNRTEHGLVGDCDFEGVSSVASAMTPVPGGIGPMTIAQLLINTVSAWRRGEGSEVRGKG
jgi:methylenetetrahydrofolate dehydrogenase (NADP+) / methenyltetrahydrofolate cyclohydrolase